MGITIAAILGQKSATAADFNDLILKSDRTNYDRSFNPQPLAETAIVEAASR